MQPTEIYTLKEDSVLDYINILVNQKSAQQVHAHPEVYMPTLNQIACLKSPLSPHHCGSYMTKNDIVDIVCHHFEHHCKRT